MKRSDCEKDSIKNAAEYIATISSSRAIKYGRGGNKVIDGSINMAFRTKNPAELETTIVNINGYLGQEGYGAILSKSVSWPDRGNKNETEIVYRAWSKEHINRVDKPDALMAFIENLPGCLERE
jgi:hypothetical protein